MKLVFALALCAAAGAASAQVVDGSRDGVYGSAIVVQNTQTQFGDSNLAHPRWANGSELDAAYARVSGGTLYLMLTGNLESNYNKLEIFVDSQAGGQNQLRGDNPDVDFNGLNRMAGLAFESGFEADYWISATGGDTGGGNYGMFVNYAELLTNGGGQGGYVGTNTGGGGGLSGGNNPFGLDAAIDNSNTGGVGGGTGFDAGSGASVTTGVEFAIPLAAIGNPNSDIVIRAFINGGGHDFLSNQFLGGIGGGSNLGEPRSAVLPGSGFRVAIPTPGAAALLGLSGLVTLRRRRA